jgi:7,8-dihydropterin-6-yl-methyl-4-(beta-D-ribofuranosyl)aminobenzene 5'-phosphate synthase
MMMGTLVEVDELEITVIVDNEVDVMSAISPGTVEDSRRFPDIAVGESRVTQVGELSLKVMPMESICCGAHGLSVIIVRRYTTTTVRIAY